MVTLTFPLKRGAFTQIAFTFTSMEPLGLLQTAYVEDDQGVDGQVTVLEASSGRRHVLLLTGLGHLHERFRGFASCRSPGYPTVSTGCWARCRTWPATGRCSTCRSP